MNFEGGRHDPLLGSQLLMDGLKKKDCDLMMPASFYTDKDWVNIERFQEIDR
jgi:hypothetical protein